MPAATLQTLGELASDKSNLLMVLSGLTRDKVDQVSTPPPSPARGGAPGPRARSHPPKSAAQLRRRRACPAGLWLCARDRVRG